MSCAFDNLIGKRINGFFLANDDWTLLIRTSMGQLYRYDTEKDCCNSVWFNHISGIELVIGERNNDITDIIGGSLVTEVIDKGWSGDREWTEADGGEYGEIINDGFWTIRTEDGDIDIEVRNSHNGYYGGSVIAAEVPDLVSCENLREIVKDF